MRFESIQDLSMQGNALKSGTNTPGEISMVLPPLVSCKPFPKLCILSADLLSTLTPYVYTYLLSFQNSLKPFLA